MAYMHIGLEALSRKGTSAWGAFYAERARGDVVFTRYWRVCLYWMMGCCWTLAPELDSIEEAEQQKVVTQAGPWWLVG